MFTYKEYTIDEQKEGLYIISRLGKKYCIDISKNVIRFKKRCLIIDHKEANKYITEGCTYNFKRCENKIYFFDIKEDKVKVHTFIIPSFNRFSCGGEVKIIPNGFLSFKHFLNC